MLTISHSRPQLLFPPIHMKIFALTAFVGSVAAVKKGGVAASGPSTRFTDPNHVSVPHPNPKITEVSLLRCVCRDHRFARV